MKKGKIFTACVLMTLLAACGGDVTGGEANNGEEGRPDAGASADVDEELDGGDAARDFVPPQLYQLSSGGGSVQGDGYRAVIGIGATTLRGQVEGEKYRVRFGPVSP
jgi:hypothetical protein